jgi:hypothetical protein
MSELAPPVARALIRALGRGTALTDGIRHIHVGHAGWLAAQDELLEELAEDGNSEAKFVRGSYGAGKSHFLGLVQENARNAGWVTAHLECSFDKVEIDRFETLYFALLGKLRAPVREEAARAHGDPLAALFEAWLVTLKREARIRTDGVSRPFDADDRLFRRLGDTLHRSGLAPDFVTAATAFARAHLDDDRETISNVLGWMKGANRRVAVPARYSRRPGGENVKIAGSDYLTPITRGNVVEAMRGLLWLVRAADFSGLVLCIDEVEELAKIRLKKRQDQALQALREFIDHAGGQGSFGHLCMYLAATPEMFESPDYFARYDALATRIQPVSGHVNYRAPIIDLDKTPLTAAEMRLMAGRIADVHALAYPQDGDTPVDDEYLDQILKAVVAARSRTAKPRLLARVVVDELERARQQRSGFASEDATELVARAASAVARETDR